MSSEEKNISTAYLLINSEVFPLEKEMTNIGRKLDNDIVIHDPNISRNHAQIRMVEGQFLLLDLNSTGGTLVNDQPAQKSVLYSGDTISMAGVIAKFVQDTPKMISKAMERTGPLQKLELKEPPTQIRPSIEEEGQ